MQSINTKITETTKMTQQSQVFPWWLRPFVGFMFIFFCDGALGAKRRDSARNGAVWHGEM